MKRVLITGAGSYLGGAIEKELKAFPEAFAADVLDVKESGWAQASFAGVDAVVHVAGIAHQKETAENADAYDRVNRALAIRVAEKAKAEGVGQFVFFSSMSVYGKVCGRITEATPPAPNTHYGKSKWEAEEALRAMADDRFRVAILRPPMVYGRGCKGNYPRLSAMVQKLPVFPRVQNERSMLYIGCLCGFVRRLLASGEGGLFFPQNREYVSTDELARQIALAHGKRLWQPRGFGWLLQLLSTRVGTIGKVFGTLTYDKAMSTAFQDEPQPDFAKTVRYTEGLE